MNFSQIFIFHEYHSFTMRVKEKGDESLHHMVGLYEKSDTAIAIEMLAIQVPNAVW